MSKPSLSLSHSSSVISQNLNFSLIAEPSPPLADEGMGSIVVIAFKVLIGGTMTDNMPLTTESTRWGAGKAASEMKRRIFKSPRILLFASHSVLCAQPDFYRMSIYPASNPHSMLYLHQIFWDGNAPFQDST